MTHELSPLDELRRAMGKALAEAAQRAGIPQEVVDNMTQTGRFREAVHGATDGWIAKRRVSPAADDHPLQEVRYGHRIEAVLPFVPETEDRAERRRQRSEAFMWAIRAHELCRRGLPMLEPPPERVSLLELLEQDTWWRQQVGNAVPEPTTGEDPAPFTQPAQVVTAPIRLDRMTHGHRLNLLGWLQARAKHAKALAEQQFMASISGPLGPSGDMACDAVDREFGQLLDESPQSWLARQPLVQALARWVTVWVDDPKLQWHRADDWRDSPPSNVLVVIARRPIGQQVYAPCPRCSECPDGRPARMGQPRVYYCVECTNWWVPVSRGWRLLGRDGADYDNPVVGYHEAGNWYHASDGPEPNHGGMRLSGAMAWSWLRGQQLLQYPSMVPGDLGVGVRVGWMSGTYHCTGNPEDDAKLRLDYWALLYPDDRSNGPPANTDQQLVHPPDSEQYWTMADFDANIGYPGSSDPWVAGDRTDTGPDDRVDGEDSRWDAQGISEMQGPWS